MNRPDFEDYKWKYRTQWNYDVARYVTNIEEYCDKLEKALDKTCQTLVNMKNACDCYEFETCPFRKNCSEGTNYCYDKDEWKEWALKDE